MLRQTLDALARSSPRFRRAMIRTWYESLVVLDRNKRICFMNYGYSEGDPADTLSLSSEESANRYAIQLYHYLAASTDLMDQEVVEIGSGRGGGAAYVSRTFKPRSMLGIDISKNAVGFCNAYYSDPHLSFSHGDAENIPLADASVDAVINVESSHCYGSMERFLGGVRRILRPGGHFLFADHRDEDQLPLLRRQFEAAGFMTVTETDITPNVVKALELDNERKRELIQKTLPRVLWHEAEEFAALVGTRAYESFSSGASRYVGFVLKS